MMIQESAVERQLYRTNPWWDDGYSLEEVYDRPSAMNRLIGLLDSRSIVFLTGLRRIGKTTLMRMMVRHCIDNGLYKSDAILYISADDYIIGQRPFVELIELFRRIHRHPFSRPLLVFIDEITWQPDFEQQLKTIYDTQMVKVFASSSSASLLSRQKALLTGRSRVVEVLPLTFEEYLAFKKISIAKADSHLTGPYFEDFLRTGGVPEYVLTEDGDYLKDMIDDIIMKDIAAAHTTHNVGILRDFFLLCMERAGKVVSINKLANILGISPDTSRRYFGYFIETYLIHPISRYGKTNERILSPKKIYAADLGMRTLYTGFRDKGSLFENYLFFLLKHRRPTYIVEDGIEIDFYTDDRWLIEAKYGLEQAPRQKKLFDSLPAERKLVIRCVEDIRLLESESA